MAKPLLQGMVPLLIGAVGIHNVTAKARFDIYSTVDVVTLIASGFCLGVALMTLMRVGERVE